MKGPKGRMRQKKELASEPGPSSAGNARMAVGYQDRMIHRGYNRKCPECGGSNVIGKTLNPGPEGGVWCHCQGCGRAFLFKRI